MVPLNREVLVLASKKPSLGKATHRKHLELLDDSRRPRLLAAKSLPPQKLWIRKTSTPTRSSENLWTTCSTSKMPAKTTATRMWTTKSLSMLSCALMTLACQMSKTRNRTSSRSDRNTIPCQPRPRFLIYIPCRPQSLLSETMQTLAITLIYPRSTRPSEDHSRSPPQLVPSASAAPE